MKLRISIGILALFLFVFASLTFSDSWLNLYDVQNPDYLRIAPAENGVYIGGLTVPLTGPRTFWILRVNSDGTVAWKKNFVGPDASLPELFPFSIIALNDGSVLVWGNYSDSLGNSAAQTAMKISDSGEILWKRKYTGGGVYNEFQIDTISENADGTFALMGSGLTGQYIYSGWFAKLAADGTITSQKVLDPSVHRRVALTSLSISDGVIMAGGKCQIQGSNCINPIAWIAKYSTSGTSQWEKQIAVPALSNPLVHFVRQTTDGGFLVGIGNPQVVFPPVSILVNLNSIGVFQWSKSFGQAPDNEFQFKAMQDGGMIVMRWPLAALKKMDEAAINQWDKLYDPLPGFYSWGYDMTEGSDGALYVVGPYSCDGQTNNGLFVMKVSNTGDSCTASSTNTTAQSTPSTPVSTLAAPSETSSPMFTVTGEFTGSDSSAPATLICNSEGFHTSCVLSTLVCGADTITFDFPASGSNSNKKVLIHKYGTTPCVIQPPQPPTGDCYPEYAYQTQDRKIKIKATVRDGCGQPLDDKLVYFTVKDPPDTSGYVSNPQPNDNLDTSDPLAGTVTPGFATSANGGIVETELTITGKYSGDNYQIEARFQSPTDPVQATSGTLTAWKRMYLEHDQMYKVGEFITIDSGPGSGNPVNKVYVNNVGTFAIGDAVHVFSATNRTGQSGTVVNLDTFQKWLALSFNLTSLYPATVAGFCHPFTGTFNAYCAVYPYSFVAKISAGRYDLLPTDTRYDRALSDPFVEVKVLTSNYLPAWPIINKSTPADVASFMSLRTFYYFENKNMTNHVQLVSAGNHQVIALSDPLYGLSKSAGPAGQTNVSWIFWQKIKDSFSLYQNATDSVTAHELVHQWNVNTFYQSQNYHCNQQAWLPLGPDPWCLIYQSRSRSEGVQKLHIADPSEIWCMRNHEDSLFVDPTVCP